MTQIRHWGRVPSKQWGEPLWVPVLVFQRWDVVEVSGVLRWVLVAPPPLCITLKELGFIQPSTPIKTDNSSSEVIVTATVIKKGPRQWILYLIG